MTTLYRNYELPCGCKIKLACAVWHDGPEMQEAIEAAFQDELAAFKARHGIHPEALAEETPEWNN